MSNSVMVTRRYSQDVMFLQAPKVQVYRVYLYDTQGQLLKAYSDSECSREQVENRARERYPQYRAEIKEID